MSDDADLATEPYLMQQYAGPKKKSLMLRGGERWLLMFIVVQAGSSMDQAAVLRFRAALAAKDEVEAHLESELAAARAQAASYEHR